MSINLGIIEITDGRVYNISNLRMELSVCGIILINIEITRSRKFSLKIDIIKIDPGTHDQSLTNPPARSQRKSHARPEAPCTTSSRSSTTPKHASRPSAGWRGSIPVVPSSTDGSSFRRKPTESSSRPGSMWVKFQSRTGLPLSATHAGRDSLRSVKSEETRKNQLTGTPTLV